MFASFTQVMLWHYMPVLEHIRNRIGITSDYQRELRLWLEGDRTWAQCCSGLIGRITRRAPGSGPAGV